MSNLSEQQTATLVGFVSTALCGSRYARQNGRVNVRRAAFDLAAALAERHGHARLPGNGDADRKLLERVLGGDVRTLRRESARRVLSLAACIDRAANLDAGRLWSRIAQVRRWREDWFAPASSEEAAALRLESWDLAKLTRHRLRALREQPDRQEQASQEVDGDWPKRLLRGRVALAKRLLGAPVSHPELLETQSSLDEIVQEAADVLDGRRPHSPELGIGDTRGAPLPAVLLNALAAFERAAMDDGHDLKRVDLAIRRLLGPLCAWWRSGGACRGWHQLTKAEKRSVLHAGITAERVWLGRGSSPN
jgi:hypothetical protein